MRIEFLVEFACVVLDDGCNNKPHNNVANDKNCCEYCKWAKAIGKPTIEQVNAKVVDVQHHSVQNNRMHEW